MSDGDAKNEGEYFAMVRRDVLSSSAWQGLNKTAQNVLLAMKTYIPGGVGAVWPSVPTIVRITRAKERMVRYAIRDLIDAGWIAPSGTAKHGQVTYTINAQPLQPIAPLQSVAGAMHCRGGDAMRCRGRGAMRCRKGMQRSAPKDKT